MSPSPLRARAVWGVAIGFAAAACGGGASNVSPRSNASMTAESVTEATFASRAQEPRTGDATAEKPAPGPAPASSAKPSTGLTNAPTTPAPSPSGSTAKKQDAVPPKRIGARHVLVQWMGSERAPTAVVRSREQALAVAEVVLKRARAGEDFARLAVEFSDEPNAAARGGSLGRFGHGQMVPAFDAVAFKLDVGEISDIVETPFGFHVIQRTE